VVLSVLCIALLELYGTLQQARGLKPARLLGLAAAVVLLVGAHLRGTQALSFGLTMTVIAVLLWYLADPAREQVTVNVASTLLGVVYIPFFGSFAVLLRELPDGTALTLAFIGAVVFYDVGAYAAGSMFGRHRIAPEISPSKTWEGAVGASIFVFAMALAIGPHMGPLDVGSSAALAAVVCVTAPMGDLAESLLKRDLGVKDMGTLLPGHGGMLDRLDALLLTAPAAYWLIRGLVF
jgi:phosphatidate cytidylyltransferase